MKANLRHMRLLLAVADTGSVTQAAAKLHVTQPAVSAALHGIEAALGTAMFERHAKGLQATAAGAAVALRIRRALGLLDPALIDLSPRLPHRVTMAQLTALAAVADWQSFSAAARHLHLAQPTVHRAVRQIEGEVGRNLFERTAQGVIPTRAARALVLAIRLAQSELDQVAAELADLSGREVGRVVIGAMPLSRSVLLGPAIALFRLRWKTLAVRVIEGPYTDLVQGLRRGEIDVLVGALRPAVADLTQEALLQDEMAIVARPGHPLTKAAPKPADMVGCAWVVAAPGAPARDHFDAMFQAAGLTPPVTLVETGSMALLCDLVGRTDHLGFVSALQVERDIARSTLARVPFHPKGRLRAIGLTTRQGWHPTRAQRDICAALRGTLA